MIGEIIFVIIVGILAFYGIYWQVESRDCQEHLGYGNNTRSSPYEECLDKKYLPVIERWHFDIDFVPEA